MSQDVLFIAPIYRYHPILMHSLIVQRNENWKLLLLHDGPAPNWLRNEVHYTRDDRVTFHETHERVNRFGHNLRDLGITIAKELDRFSDLSVIIHTNADNYYTPDTVTITRRWLLNNPSIAAVYFDCVHNYFKFHVLVTELKYSKIDLGCVAYQPMVALKAGFPYREKESDWMFLESIVLEYGEENIRKIPGVHFVHN